ncbi:hypothetical protein OROMI_007459 [Orobanche minor]
MESPSANPDIKKKNTMCPSPSASCPDLSSNNKNKMCVVVYLSGQPSVFLVDLDFKYDNVDANGFADMKPNFRVAGDSSFLYMCVVDATLYLLQMDVAVRPVIYSIDLQQVAEMSDRKLYLNKKIIKKRAKGLGPKRHPNLVAYRGNIIFFSTLITYEYECDDASDPHPTDFELFNTKTGEVKKLPRLIVCRMNMSFGFDFKSCTLYDPLKKKHYDQFDACRSKLSESEYFFRIRSFVVDEDEDTLIVKTDLGRMFCLKLDGSDDGWRLCEEDKYVLMSGKNIMTRNGICFDDSGASVTRRWLHQSNRGRAKKDSVPRYVLFPSIESEIEDKYGLKCIYNKGVPSFNLRKVGGDDDDDQDQCMLLCTARQAVKDNPWSLDTSEELYVFLQVWKVNLEEFPVDDKEENTDKFLKRMTCFKFRVPKRICLPLNFLGGLFYY